MTNHRSVKTREITAAVVRQKGGPFQIETLTLEEPRSRRGARSNRGDRNVPHRYGGA